MRIEHEKYNQTWEQMQLKAQQVMMNASALESQKQEKLKYIQQLKERIRLQSEFIKRIDGTLHLIETQKTQLSQIKDPMSLYTSDVDLNNDDYPEIDFNLKRKSVAFKKSNFV